ncbi:hypothetical protein GCM10009854_06120 [Saccharopolyspora halophila]|uniref:Proteins of 100 residues with WXG n=1 Tax=Saccharopolyspora halophila TaxID=405551 RepID=A0ABN3FMG0_9PSEU
MGDSLVSEVNDKADELTVKIDEFFAQVNEMISWVPAPFTDLIEPIEQGMRELRVKVQEFWKPINEFIDQLGDPDRLREVSDQWATAVGDKLGDIAGDINLQRLKANIEWSGPAAEAYKALVPAQSDGLTSIKDVAMQLRTSLNSLANAIDAFLLAISVAFGVFIVGAVGAIAAACTVVGTPAAIAAIATAAGVSIGLVTTAIISMNSFADTIETEQTGIKQKVTDLGDTWSRSTHDLGDGSVSDGDRTEWSVPE